MGEIIQKIPFLRLTIAFSLGILLSKILPVSNIFLITGTLLILPVLIVLNKNYKFRYNQLFGTGIHIVFMLLGIILFNQYNKKPDFIESERFVATVLEVPQEKTKSFKSLLKITGFTTKDSLILTNEKVLAYFEKNSFSEQLKSGDIILCKQHPNLIKNNGNPFEFDYKQYLERQKIYRQVYLSSENWIKTGKSDFSLITRAEQIREKLLGIYRNQPIDKKELEILSALTLGYKRELDPETRRVFSSAGAMHVLAVSGLHVGIIFWIISIFFGFLRKRKSGRLIFMCFAILVLWIYAFITGLSPSVMRAATMFSIYIIGENIQRRTNIYNSLAASALILLLINPNNIFETGFQLSYSAVFGIVFLQPKIESLIKVNNRILQFFRTLLTVSIAAQIATFPFILYYFGQFPTYFWITNIIMIPAVMILIPMGIALLFFSQIPLMSGILSISINFLIKAVYFFLAFIEELPFSILQISSIGYIQFISIILTLFFFFIFLENNYLRYLKYSLLSLLFLFGTLFYFNMLRSNSKEIIVYNSTGNIAVHLINGKLNYLISEVEINPEDYVERDISATTRSLNLNNPVYLTISDSLSDKNIFIRNGLVFFEGKTIIFNKGDIDLPDELSPDYFINPVKFDFSNEASTENRVIITNKRFNPQQAPINYQFHNTFLNGAFRKKW